MMSDIAVCLVAVTDRLGIRKAIVVTAELAVVRRQHVPSLGCGVQMSIRRSNIWNMSHDDSASSQSLERGLAILSAFTPDCPALGISQLAQRLGLTRSTTHRYVATLAKLGYLDQDDATRKYRLGIRVLDLGFSVLGSLGLREIAAPPPPGTPRTSPSAMTPT